MTTSRGTSNKNQRGSFYDVCKRKEWLLKTYAADWSLVRVTWAVTGETTVDLYVISVEELRQYDGVLSADEVPTARCYRCGALVWFETISVDRIVPGCQKTARFPRGGTYVRENIRPACDDCNSKTGAALASRPRVAKVAVRKNKPKEMAS